MIRIVEPADTTPVAIEPPPNKANKNTQPMWMQLGPSMTMILPMAAGVLATPFASSLRKKVDGCGREKLLKAADIAVSAGYVLLFVLSVAAIVNHSYSPFLYFRF